MLEGLRGDDSIVELCRKEGIAQSLYYTWSKEFMEAGKRRLAGDTARAATTGEVQDLRREARCAEGGTATRPGKGSCNRKDTHLHAFTVGGVVAPGEVIMEIVPVDRNLVITARLAPGYADDLQVGQNAQVRFPGLHSRNLPFVDGRISSVSADSKTDDRTGQSFFQIEVQVPRQALEREMRAARLSRIVAGMPAEVFVTLRRRTALEYLLEPVVQSFWYAGREQ